MPPEETTATGNVATVEGKTPVDIAKMVSDQMDTWDEDVFLGLEEQAVPDDDDGETADVASAPDLDSEQPDAEEEDGEPEDEADMSGKKPETADTYNDGTPGALRYLRDHKDDIPESVLKAVESLQSEFTKVTQDNSGKARDYDAKMEKVEALLAQLAKANDEPEADARPDPNDPLSQVTPQQKMLFERMAESLGFVKKETLNQEKQQATQSDYISASDKEAIAEFGEEFGVVEDDEVKLSATAAKDIRDVYERLADKSRGATRKDLLVLARYPALIEKAKEEAVEAYKADLSKKNGQRVTQRRNAATVTQSRAPRQTTPKIKVDKNDPNRFDKVMEQAAALGFSVASKQL